MEIGDIILHYELQNLKKNAIFKMQSLMKDCFM